MPVSRNPVYMYIERNHAYNFYSAVKVCALVWNNFSGNIWKLTEKWFNEFLGL